MTDIFSMQKRSEVMSRIKGHNTGPELTLRSLLHRMGFRFRLHRKDLPGRPDIVLPKYKSVIFVHGCFWHRHKDCRYAYNPKSRIEFWQTKFKSNVARDAKVARDLLNLGWQVITVWECELRDQEMLLARINDLLSRKNIRVTSTKSISHAQIGRAIL